MVEEQKMSAQTITYQHWRVEWDTDGVAWATIDCDGQPSRPSTNTLSQPVMEELAQILDECSRPVRPWFARLQSVSNLPLLNRS